MTVSPDVSSTTNLAGWLNKVGVWSPSERRNWFDDDAETIMHWREKPTGQHIELGIAETNLVGLIGELGATWSRWGQPLFPIGVLYDPFVERALEPWSFGIYAGGQSILVGTPSGVTLAAEGRRAPIDQDPVDRRWSSPAASATNRHSPSTSSGPAGLPVRSWAARWHVGLSSTVHPPGRADSWRGVPSDPAARERRRRQVDRRRLPARVAPTHPA